MVVVESEVEVVVESGVEVVVESGVEVVVESGVGAGFDLVQQTIGKRKIVKMIKYSRLLNLSHTII